MAHTQFKSDLDKNGNGELDPDEVTSSTIIKDGKDGKAGATGATGATGADRSQRR